MSDSGHGESKSRRPTKGGFDSGPNTGRSRKQYDSDESEDPQPRRRDRSPHRGPGRRHGNDESDKDHSRKDRRDRRERDSERNYVKNTRRRKDYRTRSESQDNSRHRRRSRSPPPKRRRRSESTSKSPPPNPTDRRSRAPLPSQAETFHGNQPLTNADGAPVEKQKPNYKPTGLLAKEANTVAGTTTVLKYHEPPEARKPPSSQQWRIYVFKGKDLLDTIHLHTRSAWLLGRDEKVTDYHLEHPSASKQHAVIQFRYISKVDEFGAKTGRVKPYLIDLESANGTKLNGEKVKPSRYVEVMNDDVLVFGESEREFVVMLPEGEKK